MNVLPARREGGELRGAGFRLGAPEDLSEGGELLLGLRPQDLQVAAEGLLEGEVTSVERLGFDGYAYLTAEAGPIAARFEGEGVQVGATVKVRPLSDALHVFTADGTRALRHPPAH